MADMYKKKPGLTHICGRLNIMARTPYPNLAEPKQKPDFHTQIRTFGNTEFFGRANLAFFVTAQPDLTGEIEILKVTHPAVSKNRDFHRQIWLGRKQKMR